MAGEWIKVRKDLEDDPAVFQMATIMSIQIEAVIGYLVRFWKWVDSHVRNGDAPSVTKKYVSSVARHEAFADALEKVGWARFTEKGLTIPNFDRHLSHNAKSRVLTKDRMKRLRDGGSVTKSSPEKRREEKSISLSTLPQSGGGERDIFPSPTPTDEPKKNPEIEAAWELAERLLPTHQPTVNNPRAYILKTREDCEDPHVAFPWLREAEQSPPAAERRCPGCGRVWEYLSKKTGATVCLECERRSEKALAAPRS